MSALTPLQRYARAVQALAKARRKASRRNATAADREAVARAEAVCVEVRRAAWAAEVARGPDPPTPRPPWR